jgi:hypothetical protein
MALGDVVGDDDDERIAFDLVGAPSQLPVRIERDRVPLTFLAWNDEVISLAGVASRA